MLLVLAEWLQDSFTPASMCSSYLTMRAILGVLTALALSLVVWVRK